MSDGSLIMTTHVLHFAALPEGDLRRAGDPLRVAKNDRVEMHVRDPAGKEVTTATEIVRIVAFPRSRQYLSLNFGDHLPCNISS